MAYNRDMPYFSASRNNSPYANLAAEEYLTENVDSPTLFLWVNFPSVIVGKFQNIYSECDLGYMRSNGILPVRRTTGGGAVYHDLGNLNYSFIMPNSEYDVKRQNKVISDALTGFGIEPRFGGRNDLEILGRKAGGAAYFKGAKNSLHHGTLLISLDLSEAERALTPNKLKLAAKGVDSVRRRIINLSDLNSDITAEKLIDALLRSFGSGYGVSREVHYNEKELAEKEAKFSSDEYVYGLNPPFDVTLEGRLSVGTVALSLSVKRGVIEDCLLTGDFLDESLPERIKSVVLNRKYTDLKDIFSVSETLSEFARLTEGDTGRA